MWLDGITRLHNLTYIDSDNDSTFVQDLAIVIEASGAPEPTLSKPPAPFASPSGFSGQITDFLAVKKASEAVTAHARMFLNVNPDISGDANGTVVAARSGPSYTQKDPDYEYNWVRDSSLTMDIVQKLYTSASNPKAKAQYLQILFEYATARATEQNDPDLQTGLGEPKFYLNNTIFSLPWGRPQNDGPATSAITLMEFAKAYLSQGGSLQSVKQKIYDSMANSTNAPLQKDLLFIASNWSSPSFDLWEEVEADHFYTRMVQRRALVMGTAFAKLMGDRKTAATLSAQISAISADMNQFWDPNRQILLYAYSGVLNNKTSYLDTAIMLGIQHGYANDSFYSYTNDRVLSTAVRIATSFIDIYPIINKTQQLAIGRYPEDVFNGYKNKPNGGNPWFLCTATFAQFMYSVSAAFSAAGSISISNTNLDFFNYFTPGADVKVSETYEAGSQQFGMIIDSLNGWGDAFMGTIKYFVPSSGHLTEEIDRDTGAVQGAADLTWSYASVLSAALARAQVTDDKKYAQQLADLGVQANT